MLLTLLRHGEAQTYAETDQMRQLTERGHADNLATARALLTHSPQFSHALHSPYTRAQETAGDLSAVVSGIKFDSCAYLTPDQPVEKLIRFLEQLCLGENVTSLLLVGHNPLLSRLLSMLIDGNRNGSRHLDTSNLVCLNITALSPACAELLYWLQPQRCR